MKCLSGLLHGDEAALLDIFPIHDVIDEGLEIVATAVPIVDVISVLPQVHGEDRRGTKDQRILGIASRYGSICCVDFSRVSGEIPTVAYAWLISSLSVSFALTKLALSKLVKSPVVGQTGHTRLVLIDQAGVRANIETNPGGRT